MYPFTISHSCDKEKRSYTLYASSEQERENWRKAFQQARTLREVRQDANKWFAPHTINEGFFKTAPLGVSTHAINGTRNYTGPITCATPFCV